MFTPKNGLILGLAVIFSFSCLAREKKVGICADPNVPMTDYKRSVCNGAEQISQRRTVKKEKKALYKQATKVERKAIKKLKKVDEDKERFARVERATIANAAVQNCGAGVRVFTDPVMLAQSDDYEHVLIMANATGGSGSYNSLSVTVTNPSNTAFADIKDSLKGMVARNVCPGGTITLFRAINTWNLSWINWQYTATARYPDGFSVVAQSPTYSLYFDPTSIGPQQNNSQTWTISFPEHVMQSK